MEQRNSVESFINKRVYLDSNILMDKKCEDLLAELIHNKIIVKIPQIQYDEIYNLSKSTDSEKSFAGRNALRNIESLLDHDLLEKLDIGNTKNARAYADPEFIKLIFEDLNNNQNVIFITEDRDLRIQIKMKLKDNQHLKDMIQIYSLDELSYPLKEKKEQQLKQQKEEIQQEQQRKKEEIQQEQQRKKKEEMAQKRKDEEILRQKSMGYEFCPNCDKFVKPKETVEQMQGTAIAPLSKFMLVALATTIALAELMNPSYNNNISSGNSDNTDKKDVNLILSCPYCNHEFGRTTKKV